jgi:phage/conjugal plasmid C-4 type zinc finger TraR family protein
MSSDVSDQATDLEEQMRAEAVARRRAEQAHDAYIKAVVPPGSDCRRCGDPIPVERRTAVPDCIWCHPCKQATELDARGRR